MVVKGQPPFWVPPVSRHTRMVNKNPRRCLVPCIGRLSAQCGPRMAHLSILRCVRTVQKELQGAAFMPRSGAQMGMGQSLTARIWAAGLFVRVSLVSICQGNSSWGRMQFSSHQVFVPLGACFSRRPHRGSLLGSCEVIDNDVAVLHGGLPRGCSEEPTWP